jgi:hypothetical protein
MPNMHLHPHYTKDRDTAFVVKEVCHAYKRGSKNSGLKIDQYQKVRFWIQMSEDKAQSIIRAQHYKTTMWTDIKPVGYLYSPLDVVYPELGANNAYIPVNREHLITGIEINKWQFSKTTEIIADRLVHIFGPQQSAEANKVSSEEKRLALLKKLKALDPGTELYSPIQPTDNTEE